MTSGAYNRASTSFTPPSHSPSPTQRGPFLLASALPLLLVRPQINSGSRHRFEGPPCKEIPLLPLCSCVQMTQWGSGEAGRGVEFTDLLGSIWLWATGWLLPFLGEFSQKPTGFGFFFSFLFQERLGFLFFLCRYSGFFFGL